MLPETTSLSKFIFFIVFIMLSLSFADVFPCVLCVCPSPGHSKFHKEGKEGPVTPVA